MNFQRSLKGVSSNNNLFKSLSKKGYKMTKLHMYTGSGFSTPSGIKACIFGSTANMGYKIAANFFNTGVPTVLVHRKPLDFLSPIGDDPLYTRSNPYATHKDFMFNFDTHNTVRKILEIFYKY